MLALIFVILLICVFVKLLTLAVRAAWGAAKILFTLVILPILLIALVVWGLVYIAIPVLVVIGILALIVGSRA